MLVINAVLKRRQRNGDDTPSLLEIHKLFMDSGRREARLDGNPLNLTAGEFNILYHLASHAGWVFTRYQIVEAVKGEDYPVTERSIDVQIVGIQKQLAQFAAYLETVRGGGVSF